MMKQNPLRLFRNEKGWTRADMARRTRVNYQTLDLLETGLLCKVTPKVMEKLKPFDVPEDLPEQYQAWRAVMAQFVEPGTGSKGRSGYKCRNGRNPCCFKGFGDHCETGRPCGGLPG
jgi:Predicted transcriptional regulators